MCKNDISPMEYLLNYYGIKITEEFEIKEMPDNPYHFNYAGSLRNCRNEIRNELLHIMLSKPERICKINKNINITCKCGHKMLDIKDTGRYVRCKKCGKLYDYDGKEVQQAYGFFIKDGKVEAPRVIDYRSDIFDDGIEEY